jgi:hypothetical protein
VFLRCRTDRIKLKNLFQVSLAQEQFLKYEQIVFLHWFQSISHIPSDTGSNQTKQEESHARHDGPFIAIFTENCSEVRAMLSESNWSHVRYVRHAYNPSTQEAKAEGSWVQCQPILHKKNISQKKLRKESMEFLVSTFSKVATAKNLWSKGTFHG